MLRKLLFTFILFIVPFSFIDLEALPLSNMDNVARVHPQTVRFVGKMDVSMSKGKTFKDRPATFIIKDNHLLCDFPKIGKMPGKIVIDLPIQSCDDGIISAQPDVKAGVMKMPLGFNVKLKLESMKDAKICDGSLYFTLTVYGKFMGVTFPTIISFCGSQR